jgi:ribosomal-protein-alanine N-acetyltransferase
VTPWSPFPELETPRLRLRALAPTDARELFRVFSDPRVMTYWSGPPYRALEEAERLVVRVSEALAAGRGIEWAITERDGGRLVGKCGFHRWEQAHRRAEIGYALASAHWNRGLATEALGAMLSWGIAALDLHTVEAQVDPRNEPSIRLLDRLGFAREGLLKESFLYEGEFCDTAIYSLLTRDRPG